MMATILPCKKPRQPFTLEVRMALITVWRKLCRVRGFVLLVGLLLCVSVLPLRLKAGQTASIGAGPSRHPGLTCNIADGFTLAAVGDLLIPRPASMNADPNFGPVLEILQNAQISFGNFEANAVDIRQFKGYPYGESGDVWVTAVPEVAADLKHM